MKQKRMCEALTKAENAKKRPDIEGELPDMPEGEIDEDFDDAKKKGKNKPKTPE